MLAEDNMFSMANDFIRERVSESNKEKIKALYIECLIEFLNVYAESELCSNVEINVPLIALYVNSPEFENVDCSYFKSKDDIFKTIELEVLMGMPIWRFLKLSDYQFNLFEKGYENFLIENHKYLMENYPCKRCVCFKELDTPFGYISKCEKIDDWCSRGESVDWTKITDCKNCIPYDADISYLKKDKPYSYRRCVSAQESFKRKLKDMTSEKLDKYKVTLKDLKDANISLLKPDYSNETERTSLILKDFEDAFSNKRSKAERRLEIKKALYLECFIEFVNLFIQNEIGSNFQVDICKCILYLNEYLNENDLEFTSKEELYISFENMIINGFDFTNFVKHI